MQLFQKILLLAFLTTAAIAENPPALDGAAGHIFKIDLDSKTFELLKETQYAPQSDIGQSRFTVYWTDETEVRKITMPPSFAGLDPQLMVTFQGIDEKNSKALAEGKPFIVGMATVYSGVEVSPAPEGGQRRITGRFTPHLGEAPTGGTLDIDGKQVEVSLRPKVGTITVHEKSSTADLAKGFWQTTIRGTETDGRFVIRSMAITPLPDPRETDDPKLPRVLVIGDSISMNYHDAAKNALTGIANYHRNEGNALSSEHGVNNTELWLGNYHEKGLHWDIIQFNHGLHDLKQTYDPKTDTFGSFAIPIVTYQKNLEKQIAILKKTGAKLIWCNTTPVPTDIKSQYGRRKGTPHTYNQAALEIISKHPEILITDLHALVTDSPTFQPWWKTQDPHFYKPEEQQALGNAVAETIKKALSNPSP